MPFSDPRPLFDQGHCRGLVGSGITCVRGNSGSRDRHGGRGSATTSKAGDRAVDRSRLKPAGPAACGWRMGCSCGSSSVRDAGIGRLASANRTIGTSPASATRFGSSNTADTAAAALGRLHLADVLSIRGCGTGTSPIIQAQRASALSCSGPDQPLIDGSRLRPGSRGEPGHRTPREAATCVREPSGGSCGVGSLVWLPCIRRCIWRGYLKGRWSRGVRTFPRALLFPFPESFFVAVQVPSGGTAVPIPSFRIW
jgi:hypothetical protein